MSFALARLLPEEKKAVKERLWKRQNGVCFITQKKIDLSLDETEVDHIVPTRDKGPDDESNWAIVFARANESKQAAHLYVARVLHLLDVIREKTNDPRGANLGDVLAHFGGAKYQLHAKADGEKFQYKLTQMNLYDESMSPIWVDELSGMRTTFLRLPLEYLHHDHKINPRAIGNSIRGLIEEFHRKRHPENADPGPIRDERSKRDRKRANCDLGRRRADKDGLGGRRNVPPSARRRIGLRHCCDEGLNSRGQHAHYRSFLAVPSPAQWLSRSCREGSAASHSR